MKWTFALGLFTATTLASPALIPGGGGLNVYKLRLSSRTKSLDGQYLGVNGSTVGVFKSTSSATPVQFYPVTDRKTGLVELHTYPIGAVDEILALVGTNGLLTFSNVADPAKAAFPRGTTCDWKSFRLAGGNPTGPGRPSNALAYAGSNGSWTAFPSGNKGDWSVKWKGADTFTTADNMPIEVVYEPVEKIVDENGDGIITIA
ncbi:hypothetical protein B0T25DRAFT_331602 [Lasiosphaeria hispida]|uniref:Uncharacterized protein n=1 Tax=Lasiosphaeria hispida TaxID=260671 RepID=A0AAJ0H6A8_9PEZI|nr:hypothetical protein B0T25DRAFT_331602 [Lasiosphaeria hispida]